MRGENWCIVLFHCIYQSPSQVVFIQMAFMFYGESVRDLGGASFLTKARGLHRADKQQRLRFVYTTGSLV